MFSNWFASHLLSELRLLVAAYTDRDSWEMNAVAFDGNVYLEDHFTREARHKRRAQIGY